MSNEDHQAANSTSNTSSISNSVSNGNNNSNSSKLGNEGGLPIATGIADSSGTCKRSTDNEAAALHVPSSTDTDASESRDQVSTSITAVTVTVTDPNKNSASSSVVVVVEDPIEATAAVEGMQAPLQAPLQAQTQAQTQTAATQSIEPQAAAPQIQHNPKQPHAPPTHPHPNSYPPIHPHPNIHPQVQTVTVHTPTAIPAATPTVTAPLAIANVPTRNSPVSPVVLSNTHTKWNRNGFGQNIEPKTGKYSAAESQAVRKAIEDYCTNQNVSSSRLCSESDNRTDHLRGAWMEISKALPNRTVQSIYRHGLRLMHPFKRGAWSEEETNELLTLVTRFGKKWAEIQTMLNRSADSCRDKYREFHTDYTKGKWTDEESEQLMTFVKESLSLDQETTLEQLKHMFMDHEQQQQQQSQQQNSNSNGNVSYNGGSHSSHTSSHGCIPWMAISARMKIRSRLGCFKRFQQMTGIKSEQNQKRKRRKVVHQTPQNNGAQTVTVQAVQNVPGVPVPVSVLIDGKGQTLGQGKIQGRMIDASSLDMTSNIMGVKIVPNGNGTIGMSGMDPTNTGVIIESATAVGAAAQTAEAETSSRLVDNTFAGLSVAATASIRVGVSSRTNMTPNPITALDALTAVGASHTHQHQLPVTGSIMKRNCMASSLPVPTDTQPDMSSVSVSVPDPTNTEANDHLNILATTADTDADADTDPYYDRQLLQTLAASSFSREADVEWTAIRHPLADARGRWQEMLETYIESNDDVDEGQLLAMPVAHISKMMLEYQDQAEMAARTVDDVLLV